MAFAGKASGIDDAFAESTSGIHGDFGHLWGFGIHGNFGLLWAGFRAFVARNSAFCRKHFRLLRQRFAVLMGTWGFRGEDFELSWGISGLSWTGVSGLHGDFGLVSIPVALDGWALSGVRISSAAECLMCHFSCR